jgi:hypothetical protein
VRVTTAFKRLVRFDDVNVTGVEFLPAMVVVTVALRRRRLVCPHCAHKTRWRYDTLPKGYIADFATQGGARLRIVPPYREHLAQAFARYFMRVGLPSSLDAFEAVVA